MSRFSRGSLVACCVASLLVFLALPSRPQSSDDEQDSNTTAAEIREHYTNFNFYIVQVDPDLTVEAAKTHARDYGLRAPVLLDGRHALVRLADATVAPEAVVFGRKGNVLYRGRIDNRYATLATQRSEATEHDLRDALDAIAAGKSVTHQPPPVGCAIP